MFKRLNNFIRKLIRSPIGSVVQSAFFQNRGFSQPVFNKTDLDALLENGYQGNADVFAIINYIATLASNVPWVISEVIDEKALSEFKSIESYDIKARQLEMKALKRIDEHDLLDLMNCPNSMHSGSEFRLNWCSFKLATGNAYIHGVRPAVGDNQALIKELHIIPSQHVEILPGDFRNPVRAYVLDIDGRDIRLDPEDVSHSRYFNPEFENGQSLYGMAPLQAAFRNLDTSNEADVARMRAFINQGAVGMISSATGDDVKRMSPDELRELSDTYQDKFGGPENFNKVIFTTEMVKWDNMGLSPVDLAIITSKIFDLRTFCNIYSVNSGRFNDPGNKRFNNDREGKKADFTDAVMPLLNSLRDELAIWLVPDYEDQEGRKLFLTPDYKSVAVLQEDIQKLVAWLNTAWWITGNQKLEIMEMEKSTDPNMDKVQIPNNLGELGTSGNAPLP